MVGYILFLKSTDNKNKQTAIYVKENRKSHDKILDLFQNAKSFLGIK